MRSVFVCAPAFAAALAISACGPASSEPMDPHSHEHHGAHAHGEHGHGPLVHRFESPAEWAKEFDNPERDAWQKPTEVVALLALSPGMSVADVGAGTGYFEPHLSRAVGPAGHVIGVDVEEGMVSYLTERAAREGLTNVKATLGVFEDPKLAPASVDRILIVDTWHHIDKREAYAAKLRNALKGGGFVAIVDFTLEASHGPPKEHRIPPEQTAKELAAGGLTTEIAVETLPEQYVVIGRAP